MVGIELRSSSVLYYIPRPWKRYHPLVCPQYTHTHKKNIEQKVELCTRYIINDQ